MRARACSTQTRRHSLHRSLLGIRHVVLAVNKIDLVGYRRGRVRADRRRITRPSPRSSASPRSRRSRCRRATATTSTATRAATCPGIDGPTLLEHLESDRRRRRRRRPAVPLPGAVGQPPEPRFPRLMPARSPSGAVSAGRRGRRRQLRARVAASAEIVTFDGDLHARASAGDAVTLTARPTRSTSSRGDLLVAPDGAPPSVADQFAAHVVWMSERAAAARAAPIWLKHRHATSRASRSPTSSTSIDVNTRDACRRRRRWR